MDADSRGFTLNIVSDETPASDRALALGETPPLTLLANASLSLWDVPEHAKARLINVAENSTYLIEAESGFKSVLRVHRENYHTELAIRCELAWMNALAESGEIRTPEVIPGKDGMYVQRNRNSQIPNERFMVMFKFLEGAHPDEDQDLASQFEKLGEIAARAHNHSIGWERPRPFERLTWDLNTILGPKPIWGKWGDAPNVTPGIAALLECLEATLRNRIARFGKGPEHFGLIHSDMRLANLLIHRGNIHLIDFDDCGIGYFLYDFAAGVSFIEDSPQIPELKSSWLVGYRRIRQLPRSDEEEMDSFVMLRRLALLAWIGSHIEAPEPQRLAAEFAYGTAELAETYLTTFG